MAKKQATATKTAAAARPARAAKLKTTTPRVRTAKHSKTVTAEAAVPQTEAVPVDTPQTYSDPHAAISMIAYSYWESRGYQGGSQEDDWLRAEQEYRQRFEQI
jgi:hypothetical protein